MTMITGRSGERKIASIALETVTEIKSEEVEAPCDTERGNSMSRVFEKHLGEQRVLDNKQREVLNLMKEESKVVRINNNQNNNNM